MRSTGASSAVTTVSWVSATACPATSFKAPTSSVPSIGHQATCRKWGFCTQPIVLRNKQNSQKKSLKILHYCCQWHALRSQKKAAGAIRECSKSIYTHTHALTSCKVTSQSFILQKIWYEGVISFAYHSQNLMELAFCAILAS